MIMDHSITLLFTLKSLSQTFVSYHTLLLAVLIISVVLLAVGWNRNKSVYKYIYIYIMCVYVYRERVVLRNRKRNKKLSELIVCIVIECIERENS
uniref:Uncharacterized protein n=1 Tax=Cannabis sativa TaxID=3483 RepID=A0A803QWA8_CANSA